MEWIMNALANVVLEALNDMLVWTTQLMTGFQLNIGLGEATGAAAGTAGPQQGSLFESTFSVNGFQQPILVLAMFIVIMSAVLKLYQSMGGPFTQSEEPGIIAIRTIFAGCGVILSYQIFVLVEKGFNKLYQNFVGVYTGISKDFNSGSWLPSTEEREQAQQALNNMPQSLQGRNNPVTGDAALQASNIANGESTGDGVFNLFDPLGGGGDSLIKDGAADPSLGLIIIEVVIACTLMICLFRLVLECYERYVLIGVMYITAPLAFSTLVSKQSQVFRNWCIMLVCQFILMCTNLLFIGGFMGAWFKIFQNLQKNGYVFENSQHYLTTMFIMIGWLLAGQKMDEHLRSLGLSAAQTGSGIMGAMMGGAGMTMAAFKTVNGAARFAGNKVAGATNAIKGASKKSGSDGIFNDGQHTPHNPPSPGAADKGGGADTTSTPSGSVDGGSIKQLPESAAEKAGETLSTAEAARANKAAFDQVAASAGTDSDGKPIFDSSSVHRIENGPVPGGSGERSIGTNDAGQQAHIYTSRNDAINAYNGFKSDPNVSVSAFAKATIAGQEGGHFVVTPNKGAVAKPQSPNGIGGGRKGSGQSGPKKTNNKN